MSDEVKRICANCACFHIETDKNNPGNTQGFCHLNPAIAQQARMEVPRLDAKGNPVLKNGQPVMNNELRIVYLYPPMKEELTCFSGWRPMGTLPGEKFDVGNLTSYVGVMKKLWEDIQTQKMESDIELRCPHGVVVGERCIDCPHEFAVWPQTD